MECCKDITIATGSIGDKGPQGLQGATGATGPIGIQGPNGTNGLDAPELKGFAAYRLPITAVALSLPKTVFTKITQGVGITTYTEVYDDWNASPNNFNPTTGIWTCPATDKYDLNVSCNLKSTNQWGNGYVAIGVVDTGTNSLLFGRFMKTDTAIEVVNITATLQGAVINANTQLKVYFLNHSNYDYSAQSGDVILFEVRKCK